MPARKSQERAGFTPPCLNKNESGFPVCEGCRYSPIAEEASVTISKNPPVGNAQVVRREIIAEAQLQHPDIDFSQGCKPNRKGLFRT